MKIKRESLIGFSSVLLALFGLCEATGAEMNWVAGTDGAWEVAANWVEKDSDPLVKRVPSNGDSIRPRGAGIEITYSAASGTRVLGASTVWQDSSATSAFLFSGGDLEVNQIYLAKTKANDAIVNFKVTGGRLFVNRNLNMTWSNSGAIDSRFQQTGGSTRFGDGPADAVYMCIKNGGQVATYDLEGGEFEAANIVMTSGGANQTAIFNQGAGTTAVVNFKIELGKTAGTSGGAVYNLDGGTLTVEREVDPFIFHQPGAPVYFDFDGGALNLKGTWDFASLAAIPNSDFRVSGVAVTEGDLVFTPITIDVDDYTQVTIADSDPVITSITALGGGGWELTLEGASDTGYEFRSSTGLSFDPGILVENLMPGDPAVGTIGADNTVLTTDGDGLARVRMMLAGPANFIVARIPPPPPPLFSEDFESGDGGFTLKVAGGGFTPAGSPWEHGNPASTSPGGEVDTGNGGSTNCWGTQIGLADDGHYLVPTETCLRSPVIDLTGVAAAELTFAEALDLEAGDNAVVNIIEEATDTVILPNIYTADDSGTINTADWKNVPAIDLTAVAGRRVRVEWCFRGTTLEYMGWYIDDVVVTAP
jgi:hypothetical protein